MTENPTVQPTDDHSAACDRASADRDPGRTDN